MSEDISFYLHRPSATDSNMAPQNHDAFYVLVPVPNNLSKIDWKIEGKNLKILSLKMSETVLPNLKDNIVEDFYLTPDYFENELSTLYGSDFPYSLARNLLILDFITNQKYLKIFIL